MNDIYYNHSRDTGFKKLAKYIMIPQIDDSITDPYLDILSNRSVVIRTKDKIVEPKLPNYLQNLLIGLLRNPIDSKLYRIMLYTRKKQLWCRFYINMEQLHQICLRGGLAPEILSIMIRDHRNPKVSLKKGCHSDIPIYDNTPPLITYNKYFNITPYDYQHNNIYWMQSIEQAITRQEHYLEYVITADLLSFDFNGETYYMDLNTTILYDSDTIWMGERRKQFKMYGGVLCDKVGLGKTLSMTGLILSDKYTTDVAASVSVPVPVPVTPKLKPKPKITGIVKIKAKIRPKIKLNPTPVKVKAKAKAPEQDLSKSKTTLVLCPRRLVAQWIMEIQKYTDCLRVVEMSTLTHVKKYTYQDLHSIDVVVASFSLFDNKNYLAQEYFRFNRVQWRRVIIDEGHEVLLHRKKKSATDTRISTSIFSISSDFRWVCSGTPLPKVEESMQAILSYINKLDHNELSPILDNITEDDYKKLMELLFHCNTRESIKTQLTIPKHRDHVEFLDFTKTERAIYDSIPDYDSVRKLQVCTNLSVSDTDNKIMGNNVLNLQQVTKTMGVYYMQNCDRLDKLIAENTIKIKDMEDRRDRETKRAEEQIKIMKQAGVNKDDLNEARDELNRRKTNTNNRIHTLSEQTQKARFDLIEYRTQLQLFKALDIDEITKGTCPIFGTPLKGKVAISPTGFYYSKEGVDIMFFGGRKTARCPCTRQQIELNALTFVDTEATDNKEEIDLERSKWGSKMARVINKLRELFQDDPDAKIIIFSQWKKMLALMAKALKDSNINHVFCQGNVHMMSKSIRLFKTDPKTRVILLSSESCNSGSNLTEASHVFLIDAINGDLENARAAETQAIARTCRMGQTREVQVYRFIIRNTIEEKYYNAITKAQ